MTGSFIPAITTGPRPTPLIIVYGAKPAARAFSLRRLKTYFFDFSLPISAMTVRACVSATSILMPLPDARLEIDTSSHHLVPVSVLLQCKASAEDQIAAML